MAKTIIRGLTALTYNPKTGKLERRIVKNLASMPLQVRQKLAPPTTDMAATNKHITAQDTADTLQHKLNTGTALVSSAACAESVADSASEGQQQRNSPAIDFELLGRLTGGDATLILLTGKELAHLFRVSLKKVEKDREHKKGPKWLKLNGAVRYRLSDIFEYMQNVLNHTGS